MTAFRQAFPEKIDGRADVILDRAVRPAAQPPGDDAGRQCKNRVAESIQDRRAHQARGRGLLERGIEQRHLLHVALHERLLGRKVMGGDVAELGKVDAEEFPVGVEEPDFGVDEGVKLVARAGDALEGRRGQRVELIEPAMQGRPIKSRPST